jgi:hypothetical protein
MGGDSDMEGTLFREVGVFNKIGEEPDLEDAGEELIFEFLVPKLERVALVWVDVDSLEILLPLLDLSGLIGLNFGTLIEGAPCLEKCSSITKF